MQLYVKYCSVRLSDLNTGIGEYRDRRATLKVGGWGGGGLTSDSEWGD